MQCNLSSTARLHTYDMRLAHEYRTPANINLGTRTFP